MEMALVVLAVGVVLGTLMITTNRAGSNLSVADEALMDSAASRLFDFARRNGRLPCPDVNGDGFEDAGNGVCAADTKSGGIPYTTLGMVLSGPVGTGIDRQFIYSVYRGGGNASQDLTLAAERSLPAADAAGSGSYMNLDDFKQAVINGLAAAPDNRELHVTGNDADSGPSNCTLPGANMAFVLAYAGGGNADGAGGDFDGANPAGGWSQSNKWAAVKPAVCFAGPGKPHTPTYDDQVRAVSFTELLGLLNR
jgi:hypothetical protein